MIRMILMVGTGGFLGTVSRFLTTRFFTTYFPSSFPFGTFVVNVLGCFIIGLIYGISEKGNFISSEWRMFLTVGFCGGFTTFSTFSLETINLFIDSQFLMGTLNIAANLLFCLAGVLAAFYISKI